MPRTFPARPTRDRLRLRLRSAEVAEPTEDVPGPAPRHVPAWLLAPIVGVGVALGGLAVTTVLVLLGWVTAQAGPPGGALIGGVRLWLLAHGVPTEIGGLHWSVIPLGVTVLLAVAIARGMRGVLDQGESDPAAESVSARSLWLLPPLLVLGYALVAAVAGLLAGSGAEAGRAAAGGFLLAAVAAGWVSLRRPALGVAARLPAWARALPSAVVGAVWVVLLGGAAALTTSLVLHAQHVTVITQGLGVEGVGSVPLILAQLLFWPNLVIWAGSWSLGAGFRLGDGSVVAPAGTDLGLVPSIPVLGALPAEGPGTWLLAWLVTGVAAGVLAATIVIRGRREAGFEETTLVSGLAGVLAALAITALGALSRGDLGVERMTGLGPRLPELLMMSSALIGLSALVVGLLAGLVRYLRRRRGRPAQPPAEPSEDRSGDEDHTVRVEEDEPTIPEDAGDDATVVLGR